MSDLLRQQALEARCKIVMTELADLWQRHADSVPGDVLLLCFASFVVDVAQRAVPPIPRDGFIAGVVRQWDELARQRRAASG